MIPGPVLYSMCHLAAPTYYFLRISKQICKVTTTGIFMPILEIRKLRLKEIRSNLPTETWLVSQVVFKTDCQDPVNYNIARAENGEWFR